MRVLPSIASANQMNLKDQMQLIKNHKYMHIDIEDGNFVNNITFGMKTVKSICEDTTFEYDVHLLVTNPIEYIEELSNCGVKKICFHIESVKYPLLVINEIKKKGMKVGLSMNFKTSVNELLLFVDHIDYLLIMTAEPDGKGCLFNDKIIDKIIEIKKNIPSNVEIWCDGGITEERINSLVKVGVSKLVLGRTIWKESNPLNKIIELENLY